MKLPKCYICGTETRLEFTLKADKKHRFGLCLDHADRLNFVIKDIDAQEARARGELKICSICGEDEAHININEFEGAYYCVDCWDEYVDEFGLPRIEAYEGIY